MWRSTIYDRLKNTDGAERWRILPWQGSNGLYSHPFRRALGIGIQQAVVAKLARGDSLDLDARPLLAVNFKPSTGAGRNMPMFLLVIMILLIITTICNICYYYYFYYSEARVRTSGRT